MTPTRRKLTALLAVIISGAMHARAATFSEEAVDSTVGAGGGYSSLAVDDAGDLHLAYHDGGTGGVLRYRKRVGVAWSGSIVIDQTGTSAPTLAITVDANRRPHIIYTDSIAHIPKYARFDGISWSTGTIDTEQNCGDYVSIAVDGFGYPHVAYTCPSGAKYSHSNGTYWSSSTIPSIPSYAAPSLALDGAGHPHIAGGLFSSGLRLAVFDGATWSVSTPDSAYSVFPSIALNGAGEAVIVYSSPPTGLKVARRNGGIWSTALADIPAGINASIAIDGLANAHISNYDESSSLRYASSTSNAWTAATVDVSWGYTNIVLDPVGDAHISYKFSGVLKAAHITGASTSKPMGGNARGRAQQPTAFRPTATYPTSIDWSWNDNSDNELGFQLYGSTSPTGPYSLIAGTQAITAGQTSFTENGLPSSATYYRYIAAMNSGGVVTSSGGIAVTLPGPPFAPVSFSGISLEPTAILWSWARASANEDGFRVMSGAANISGDLPAGASYWLQTGLSTNTLTGPLNVRAFNTYGSSTSAPAQRFSAAAPPTDLYASPLSSATVTLSWSPNTNPSGTLYNLQLSTTGGVFTNVYTGTTAASVTNGLLGATTYFFKVRAINDDAQPTAFSATISTLTLRPPPGTPGTPSGTVLGISSISWSWAAASYADDYTVRPATEPATVIASTSSLAIDIASLLPNTSFSIVVAGQNYLGAGPISGQATPVYTLAVDPIAPTIGNVSSISVSIAWSPDINPTKTNYEAFLSTNNFSSSIASSQTLALSATFYGLLPSTSYYLRVRAANHNGIATGFTNIISTLTWPPLPSAPGVPIGAVLGTSSISWSWSASSNVTSYTVRPATAIATIIASTTTTSFQLTGLIPNASFSITVAGQSFVGTGALSGAAAPIYTHAAPPSGLAASQVYVTSASLQWNLNGNPTGTTTAEVERSIDNLAFSLVFTGTSTAFIDTALLTCTTYYFRLRNRNADNIPTIYDGPVALMSIAAPPSPPNSLQANPLTGNRVTLSWVASPSTGIAQYTLYYDAGTGTINYGAPLAVFDSTTTSFTSGVLTSSAAYRFALRARGPCSVEETSGVFAISASTANPSLVRAVIKSPDAGKRINGNRVTIVGELVAGISSDVQQVTFQYRTSGAQAWSNVPAANLDHPNPDTDAPYFMHVDVTGWAPGSYDLRALAVAVSGSSDTAPSAIIVSVDPISPDIDENMVGGKVQKQQSANSAVTTTVSAAGQANGDPEVKIILPAGVLPASTMTVTVTCSPTISTGLPAGFQFVGSAVQINLSGGFSQLNGSANVTLSYPDTVGNPSLLQVQSLNENTGVWTLLGSPVIDTVNHRVSANTTHFSIFALVIGGLAASDLSSIRIFPNPYKPNGGDANQGTPFSAGNVNSGIIFDNLPRSVTITIYSLTGRQVAKFTSDSVAGRAQWDARNDSGQDVASGGYFAVISAPGLSDVVKKILIIR